MCKGIVRSKDRSLLAVSGGHIALTKSWSKHLLERMGFVKRRSSLKAKINTEDFASVKSQFLFDTTIVEMEEIPHYLVINWDQTGIHYIPVSSWTMEKEGAKRLEITAVFGGSLTGDFHPIQLIYQGTVAMAKTPQLTPPSCFCDSTTQIVDGFNIHGGNYHLYSSTDL